MYTDSLRRTLQRASWMRMYVTFCSLPATMWLMHASPLQFESLLTLWYTSDPVLWTKFLAPPGQLQSWLEAGNQAPLASFVSAEVRISVLGVITPRLWS